VLCAPALPSVRSARCVEEAPGVHGCGAQSPAWPIVGPISWARLPRKCIDFGVTLTDRFCDGIRFASVVVPRSVQAEVTQGVSFSIDWIADLPASGSGQFFSLVRDAW